MTVILERPLKLLLCTGRPNERWYLLLTQHNKTPWSTNSISGFNYSFMHLLFLYILWHFLYSLWHFSWRKLSMLQFSFPYLNYPRAEGLFCPNLLRTCSAQAAPEQQWKEGITFIPTWERLYSCHTERKQLSQGEQPLMHQLQGAPLRKAGPGKCLPWHCHCILYSGEPQLSVAAGAPGEELALVTEGHAVWLPTGHVHDVLPRQRPDLLWGKQGKHPGHSTHLTAAHWHQGKPMCKAIQVSADPKFSFKLRPRGEKAPGLLKMHRCWALLKACFEDHRRQAGIHASSTITASLRHRKTYQVIQEKISQIWGFPTQFWFWDHPALRR